MEVNNENYNTRRKTNMGLNNMNEETKIGLKDLVKLIVLWSVMMAIFIYAVNKVPVHAPTIALVLGTAYGIAMFYPDIKKGRGQRKLEREMKRLEN